MVKLRVLVEIDTDKNHNDTFWMVQKALQCANVQYTNIQVEGENLQTPTIFDKERTLKQVDKAMRAIIVNTRCINETGFSCWSIQDNIDLYNAKEATADIGLGGIAETLSWYYENDLKIEIPKEVE